VSRQSGIDLVPHSLHDLFMWDFLPSICLATACLYRLAHINRIKRSPQRHLLASALENLADGLQHLIFRNSQITHSFLQIYSE
jgi:hypothetical protein